uniref:NADH-ubiquinone oxidoreductase chain 4L n=1 Tax=Scrobicularia plana TaxID=665965 RepID=A0A6H2U2P6_9BIVA|nr:NADH dehydrogenase subunit 4L [Scrobicularia plana]
MEMYVALFLFISSLILIFSQKSHFLSVLLILELMTLSVFIMCVFSVGIGGGLSSVSFCLVFLVLGVYEAANGLGLLVSRTRSSGLDSLKSLFSLNF